MDMRFRLDGVWHDTPAGIAHYLEHKMFDTEDGNALQDLSQNGAEPNAFTSNATTAYYFDCTEHFEENLKILLSFVSVPLLHQESVDKERGIIGQEIRMVEDTPDWRVYTNLLECLYHSSPRPRRHRRYGGEHCGDHARNALCLPQGVLRPGEHDAVRRRRREARRDRRHRGGDPAE